MTTFNHKGGSMFYDKQPEKNKNEYKAMLAIVGQLSNLFSESNEPYLAYRAHENIFCKYFEADNLARFDCSADAKKEKVGIGLKTWVGRNDQKVAEFGKLKNTYSDLKGIELVKKISEYRNERIRVTKKMHGIDEMIYHVVKRMPQQMEILECAFDYIDIDNIKLIPNRGNGNNTYFTDGKHTYHFSVSKNTLYMLFDDLVQLDSFAVKILEDPYEALLSLKEDKQAPILLETYSQGTERKICTEYIFTPRKRQLCLPLYSRKGEEKYVADKSGLNQWNGVRTSNRKKRDGSIVHKETPRDPNELYIPYNKDDRERDPDFFPPRDTSFTLHLPDGTEISAKVCQEAYKKMPQEKYKLLSNEQRLIEDKRREEGKSIMSNPNKVLGKWLLRDVFELPENTVVTYEMLEKFGIDSVVFTKNSELDYSVDFAEIGTYEEFYGEED